MNLGLDDKVRHTIPTIHYGLMLMRWMNHGVDQCVHLPPLISWLCSPRPDPPPRASRPAASGYYRYRRSPYSNTTPRHTCLLPKHNVP